MCDCIEKLNEDLKPHNTMLNTRWNTRTGLIKIVVKTLQIETAHGKGWAVHGATKEEAVRLYWEAVERHKRIDQQSNVFDGEGKGEAKPDAGEVA